jgi:hypothetical protein
LAVFSLPTVPTRVAATTSNLSLSVSAEKTDSDQETGTKRGRLDLRVAGSEGSAPKAQKVLSRSKDRKRNHTVADSRAEIERKEIENLWRNADNRVYVPFKAECTKLDKDGEPIYVTDYTGWGSFIRRLKKHK